MISNSTLLKFINKIRQLYSPQYKHKKQKQMETEQQVLQNEDLFEMSAQLLRQALDVDPVQFDQYYRDEKFEAYIKSVQKIGLLLSNQFMEQEQDFKAQIQTLKVQNSDFKQKLAFYISELQDMKEIITHLENQRYAYDEKLNKSEHQIQKGKHVIINQINTNEMLIKQNQKLQSRNHQLEQQNSNLKQIIQELNRKLSQGIQQTKKLNAQLFKSRKQFEKLQQQFNNLHLVKFDLDKEIQSLQRLIDEKDYVLGNKTFKQGEQFTLSAERYYPYNLNSTFKVVRQEEIEEGGSDREIMKNIEAKYKTQRLDSILPLKFTHSRSISVASQKSSTSICVENIPFLQSNQKESPEPRQSRKILKTDRSMKETSAKKQPHNKSMTKMQEKKLEDNKLPTAKALFTNTTPNLKDKSKQKSMTSKAKRQQGSKQKLNIQTQRNASAQNNPKIRHKKHRQNASVVMNPLRRSFQNEEYFIRKGRIQHSQSVQDLYRDESNQFIDKDTIEKELLTKEKMIESLKMQNRSVRQLALEESEKRTEAQHEYEESIQKLKSELSYFKTQMKNVYSKYIQEKALCKAYEEQMAKVSDQIQRQKSQYQMAKEQLKQKCKQYIQQQIKKYHQKYEGMMERMREMEHYYASGKNSEGQLEIENQMDSDQNGKQLKKSKSNSLFYKQVRHHSYNASQQYSQINNFSASHSKNTSFLHIDEEQVIDEGDNDNIMIQDYEQEQMQEELISYQEEEQKEYVDQQVQTDSLGEYSSKNSLEFSSKMQDSAEISLEFSSLALRSSEDHSKIKLNEEKADKNKRLSICRVESITIESDKSGVSEFDTLEINSKPNEQSSITEDLSVLSKFKQLNLKIEQTLLLQVNQTKEKNSRQVSTQKRQFTIIKCGDILVQQTKLNKNFTLVKMESQSIIPSTKKSQHKQVQNDSTFFSDASIITENSHQLYQKYTQTNFKPLNQFNTASITCIPVKKFTFQTEAQTIVPLKINQYVQVSPIQQSVQCQTVVQNFTFKKTFEQSVKPIHKLLTLQSLAITQTIMPLESIKNHNQSFNEYHINEVLLDMSHSFQMSEKFIETLKKKLLQIQENLRQLQDSKQNDSSSSSSSAVQKVFGSIEMDTEILNVNSSVETVSKLRLDLFEGNVKTSKASTNCSISTSFSFVSPHRYESGEEGRMKVTQFYEIMQIESENVESLSKIELQNSSSQPLQNQSYEGSVNKSPLEQRSFLRDVSVNNFIEIAEKVGSGKKHDQQKQSLSIFVNTPKNHIIQKQRVSPFLNSSKNRLNKSLVNQKSKFVQKPVQLQQISEQDFNFFCVKYRPKIMQLVQKTFENSIPNQAKDSSNQTNFFKISSKQLIFAFCQQNASDNRKNIVRPNYEMIVIHQSKVLSLKHNYIMEASRVILSHSKDCLTLGNQEITLTENQLKFSFKNKNNYFTCHFPTSIPKSLAQSVQQTRLEVLKMFKYKFK